MRQAPSEDSVAVLRSHVRQRVQSAWSQEALRRGVAHAKAGEHEQALACYAQVRRRCAVHVALTSGLERALQSLRDQGDHE
jgi:hypothetical protein